MTKRNRMPYESVHPAQIRTKSVQMTIYLDLSFVLCEIRLYHHIIIQIGIKNIFVHKNNIPRRRHLYMEYNGGRGRGRKRDREKKAKTKK